MSVLTLRVLGRLEVESIEVTKDIEIIDRGQRAIEHLHLS